MKKIFYSLIAFMILSCGSTGEEINEMEGQLTKIGEDFIKVFGTSQISMKYLGESLDLTKLKEKRSLIIEIKNSPKVNSEDMQQCMAFTDTILTYLWNETNVIDTTLLGLEVSFSKDEHSEYEGIGSSNEIKFSLDEIYVLRANKIYFTDGDTLGAIKLYEKAINVKPENVVYVFNKAVMDMGAGNYKDVTLGMKKVLNAQPNNYDANWIMGIVNKNLELYNDAIEFFNKCLSIDSSNTDCIGEVGEAYYLKGDFENAVNYFDLSIEMDSTKYWWQIRKAKALIQKDEIELANKEINELLEIEDNTEALLVKGWIYLKEEKVDSACNVFNELQQKGLKRDLDIKLLKELSKECI